MRPEGRKARRVGLAVVVATFWLAMMLLLVRSEITGSLLRGDVVLDRQAWIEEPVESWLTLHSPAATEAKTDSESKRLATSPSFGPRVGYAHMKQSPVDRHGLEGAQLELDVQLVLQMLGRRAALELKGTAWRARTQRRADVDFAIRSGSADFQLVGTIVDDDLTAKIVSGGETSDFNLKLSDNALFTTGFGTALAFPPMELGEQLVIPSFDPMTLRATRSMVKAVSRGDLDLGNGTLVSSTRLEVRSGGLRTFAWIDSDGQVLQATTPLGLSLRKSTKEQALAPIGNQDNASEILQITAVKPTGERPVRGAASLVLDIPGVLGFDELAAIRSDGDSAESPNSQEALALPLDWRQQIVTGSTFRFNASTSAPPETGVAPNLDYSVLPQLRERYLKPDAFIQSNHPKIAQQAKAVLNGVPNPKAAGSQGWESQLQAALALHDWVYQNIEKTPVLSLPSALEVLNSRKGDCNEHTILYTALARSIGLPTRVAIGLVWSDVYDGFYYHAWPEVLLSSLEGESPVAYWIALDPTLGQPMADATHLKLLEGSIDQWTLLLPFIGQLSIDVKTVSLN